MNKNTKISEQMRKAAMIICAVVGGLGVLYFLFFIAVMFGSPYFNTIYANGFSGQKFDSIKIGMNEEEVQKTLGEPLDIYYDDRRQEQIWHYTTDKNLLKGGSHHFLRNITIKDNKVSEIIKDIYYD